MTIEIKKYRPSNSSEGYGFIDYWCGKCALKGARVCSIVDETMFYQVDDPEYPKEWRYDENDRPVCTAFVRYRLHNEDKRQVYPMVEGCYE